MPKVNIYLDVSNDIPLKDQYLYPTCTTLAKRSGGTTRYRIVAEIPDPMDREVDAVVEAESVEEVE